MTTEAAAKVIVVEGCNTGPASLALICASTSSYEVRIFFILLKIVTTDTQDDLTINLA